MCPNPRRAGESVPSRSRCQDCAGEIVPSRSRCWNCPAEIRVVLLWVRSSSPRSRLWFLNRVWCCRCPLYRLVLLWVRSFPLDLVVAVLSVRLSPLDLVVCHSPIYFLSLISDFFVVVVVVWVVVIWWFLCCVVVGFVWIVVNFQWMLVCGWWWIFWYKICLEAEKMWKICRKIAFLECYQTLKIVFWTIFHCTPKCLDFNFLTGIHFPLHSFYTRNSIYIEPNTAFVSILFLFLFFFFVVLVLFLFLGCVGFVWICLSGSVSIGKVGTLERQCCWGF